MMITTGTKTIILVITMTMKTTKERMLIIMVFKTMLKVRTTIMMTFGC